MSITPAPPTQLISRRPAAPLHPRPASSSPAGTPLTFARASQLITRRHAAPLNPRPPRPHPPAHLSLHHAHPGPTRQDTDQPFLGYAHAPSQHSQPVPGAGGA